MRRVRLLARRLKPAALLCSTTLLTLTLALPGCQGSPERSPCADVDCSGRGRCLLADDGAGVQAPTCACDTGYGPTPSGMLCLPSSDTSLCAGIDCSDHGDCVSIKGKAQCVCDTGYTLASAGLDCSDPCASVSCSGHGTCTRSPSGPSCSCDTGYRASASDATVCESTGAGAYLVYELIYDQYPTYSLGRMTVDRTEQTKGKLVEQMSFSMGWDSGHRGLRRKSRQVWTLDSSGQEVTALELEDDNREGNITRQRWTKASLDGKGGITASLQRLDKIATVSASYTGSQRPIPMLGGFEYPGWTLGCFSPLFYIQALQRYDASATDPQQLEVYYPETGQVGVLKVQAGAGSTSSKPVLEFPEWKIEVTYSAQIPETIAMTQQGISWVSHSGTPADLNLGPRPSGTTFTPAALPTDNVESAVSFSSTDGTKLSGTLTLPAGASAAVPAVLLVSDLTAQDRDRPFFRLLGAPLYKHLAAHLAHAGYASLRYDPRGRGASSSVAVDKATLAELVIDAVAARAALAGATGIDATKIFVMSHGWSSAVALGAIKGGMTARGYVALAPFVDDAEEAIISSQTQHLKLAGFSTKFLDSQKKYYTDNIKDIEDSTFTETEFMGLPVTLWQGWLAFDGAAAIKAFAGPVLLLRGDQDLESSAAQVKAAEDAATAAGKTNLTSKTLSGLGFTFAKGTAASLWEEAALPLELSTDALTPLTTWLDANK